MPGDRPAVTSVSIVVFTLEAGIAIKPMPQAEPWLASPDKAQNLDPGHAGRQKEAQMVQPVTYQRETRTVPFQRKNTGRPEFQKLLDEIRKGKVPRVIDHLISC